MNGTFLLSLCHFFSIFVILVRKERDADFSILFSLLPDKKVEIHIKLFNITHEFWPQLNPNNINVDYKLAVHQTICAMFPEVSHLASHYLLRRYNTDANFALNSKSIMSIIVVFQEDIIHDITSLENYQKCLN